MKAQKIESQHHILVLFDFLLNIADLRGDVLEGILEVGILHLQLWFDGQRFRISVLWTREHRLSTLLLLSRDLLRHLCCIFCQVVRSSVDNIQPFELIRRPTTFARGTKVPKPRHVMAETQDGRFQLQGITHLPILPLVLDIPICNIFANMHPHLHTKDNVG